MMERFSHTDVIAPELEPPMFTETVFQENSTNDNTYEYLEYQMKRLHSGFLFYRNSHYGKLCEDTFKIITTRIGGTHPSLSGWKDFAASLGINLYNIDYIDYSMKTCPTETVLKIFVQQQDATMDKLISALLEINRHDVVASISNNLTKLYELLFSTVSEDLGYSTSSWTGEDSETVDVIKPNYIPTGLPNALMPSDIGKTAGDDNEFQYDLFNIPKPFLFLTYAEDGIDCVENITKEIESTGADINVVTLEKISNIEESPELLIPDLCEKALYVVPILTKGYIDKIKSLEEVMPSSLDNKDDAYARYIYAQLTGEYVGATGCLNKKVRSILPTKESRNILMRLHQHAVLRVWTAEKDLMKFLKRLQIY